jgi:hypothetical protein
MGTTQIEPGKTVDIYLRREGFSGNNFAFLAFSFNPAKTSHTMDVNAYINWATSTATGPGTFNDIVWNNPNGARATVAAAMASPPSAGGVTPLPRTLRRPASDMVIDGVQQGSEVWDVNPSGNVAEICYDALGFIVDGQEFGKVAELVVDCPECATDYFVSGLPTGNVVQGQTYNVTVGTTAGVPLSLARLYAGSANVLAFLLTQNANGSVSGTFTVTQAVCDLINASANGLSLLAQPDVTGCNICTVVENIGCTETGECVDCSEYTTTLDSLSIGTNNFAILPAVDSWVLTKNASGTDIATGGSGTQHSILNFTQAQCNSGPFTLTVRESANCAECVIQTNIQCSDENNPEPEVVGCGYCPPVTAITPDADDPVCGHYSGDSIQLNFAEPLPTTGTFTVCVGSKVFDTIVATAGMTPLTVTVPPLLEAARQNKYGCPSTCEIGFCHYHCNATVKWSSADCPDGCFVKSFNIHPRSTSKLTLGDRGFSKRLDCFTVPVKPVCC